MTRIISSPQRDILPLSLVRPIEYWRTSAQYCPRLPWICGSERAHRQWRGRSRHHWADPGHRHQTTAYIIVPDDGQQAAMQDAKLFAKRPPDNEKRSTRESQIRNVLDKLFDAGFKLHRPNHPDLETEVA